MSYATGTTHFNLPQTVASDKRDWSDTNQAFADVDAALYTAGQDAGTALTTAQTAQTTADGAVTTAQGAVTTANGASATAQTASETAQLANNAAQAAQTTADGAVTTANSANATAQAAQTTASNADTVALRAEGKADTANGNIGTMSNLNTQDKTSLVAAINEVLGQIGGGMLFPDYNNEVVPTFPYTTPSDGFIDITIAANLGDTGTVIAIDGKNVIGTMINGVTAPICKLYPVKAGTVISTTIQASLLNDGGRTHRCVFIPAIS